MDYLQLIYALCCGFGVSFLAIQLIFSLNDSGCDSGHHDQSSHDPGDINSGGHDGTDHTHSHDTDLSDNHDTVDSHTQADSHDQELMSTAFISFLSFLRFTRKCTFFSAGFGTMGLVTLFLRIPQLLGLVYAGITGITVLLLTNWIFRKINPARFESHNSSFHMNELTGCYGEVVTKIGKNNDSFGEIKVVFREQIVQLYAKAKSVGTEFKKGENVVIYKIDPKGIALVEKYEDISGKSETVQTIEKEKREL